MNAPRPALQDPPDLFAESGPPLPEAAEGTLSPTVRAGVPVYGWSVLDAPDSPVDIAVTSRDGGVSTGPYASLNLGLHVEDDAGAVTENRRRAAATIGADLGDLVVAQQVHGCEVAQVGPEDAGRGATSADEAVPGVDALVTTTPGLALLVLVADCVPVVLLDPQAGVLAVAHAGWRGTLGGVLAATIDEMHRAGADLERIVAAIGPGIPGERYPVADDVAAQVRDLFGSRASRVLRRDPTPAPDGILRWQFDLPTAVRMLLGAAHVPADQVFLAGVDAGPGSPFFSHRAGAPTGRFGLLARLRPEAGR